MPLGPGLWDWPTIIGQAYGLVVTLVVVFAFAVVLLLAGCWRRRHPPRKEDSH